MNITQGTKSVLNPRFIYDNKEQVVKTGLTPVIHCTNNNQRLKIFDFKPISVVPQPKPDKYLNDRKSFGTMNLTENAIKGNMYCIHLNICPVSFRPFRSRCQTAN